MYAIRSYYGDVDFSTGNIVLERGNVVVHASVQDGFTVDVPGNVAVGDSINRNNFV